MTWAEIWENTTNAISTIKNIIVGFYEIITSIFSFIPSPFSDILSISVIVIIALVAVKIVRGWIMVEIIKNFIDLSTDFINNLFLLEVEFDYGKYVPIGKIVTAFIFIAYSIYLICDSLGILDNKGEW